MSPKAWRTATGPMSSTPDIGAPTWGPGMLRTCLHALQLHTPPENQAFVLEPKARETVHSATTSRLRPSPETCISVYALYGLVLRALRRSMADSHRRPTATLCFVRGWCLTKRASSSMMKHKQSIPAWTSNHHYSKVTIMKWPQPGWESCQPASPGFRLATVMCERHVFVNCVMCRRMESQAWAADSST